MITENDQEYYVEDEFTRSFCFYTFDNGGARAVIYNLYVYPEFRRRGSATKLLTRAIEEIRNTGYAGEIVIEAIPRENSISKEDLVAFYEKMSLTVLNR